MKRRALSGSLAIVLALGALAVGPTAAAKGSCAKPDHPGGDWPVFGHDYSNTRNQDKEKKIGLAEAATLQPAWVFASDDAGSGDFTGTPIVVDGCVYVGSNDGWVYAINADNGTLVWGTRVEKNGGINSTVAVSGGRVFASVSKVGKPYAVALDQASGDILWETELDDQKGSDIYSSPVVYDGFVFLGVSGGAAELGGEEERYLFQGNYSLVDEVTGRVLKKTYVIRPPDKNWKKPKDLFAGAAIWSTLAVDPSTDVGYVVSGNPFRPQKEHKYSNSILKIDLDRSNPSFGEITDHYKGTTDEYFPEFRDMPCYDIGGNPAPWYPQGLGACMDLDMDFGASPNLFKVDGKKVVGAGQKSGIYHLADAGSMKGLWKTIVGPPSAVGGIVGSTAFDENGIYGPLTLGGYLWSIDRASGLNRWFTPVGDGAHWGNPVAVANGVVYTVDLKGFLNAYDTTTGVQVLASPMWFAGGSGLKVSWGGVSIARNTVYGAVGITGGDGFIVAYRP
jgi:polyvinyl alcohol dehydrogenase (cytochrome)